MRVVEAILLAESNLGGSKDYEKANSANSSVDSQANESPVPMRYQTLSTLDAFLCPCISYTFIHGHVQL